MTNIEKLQAVSPDMLNDLRERFTENGDDSMDEHINNLSTDELMQEWCQYTIGDSHWWCVMKRRYDSLITMNEAEREMKRVMSHRMTYEIPPERKLSLF